MKKSIQRSQFEMATHNFIHRPKRDTIKATITGAYHSDKPLYIGTAVVLTFFAVILLAVVINS